VTTTARALGGALTAAIGSGAVSDDPAVLAAAAVDGLAPRWVARPSSLEEVARLLAVAHDAGLAVAPRGSGSAQALGHPPARLDLVLDMSPLSGVVEHSPDDLTATVRAGTSAGALAAHLAPYRQWLPLDPPGFRARTLGGLAATAASGPLRVRYGTLRDLLLGVRFVQADGVVTWGGAKVVKSVTGYDVPKLMVGALGTLGVLAELTLRLHPAPPSEATCLATFDAPDAALEVAARTLAGTLQPGRLEYADRGALAACGLPPAAAGLVVSIGTVEPAVRAQQAAFAALVAGAGGELQTMGAGFWRTWERIGTEGEVVALRAATLPTRLGALLARVRASAPDAIATATCGAGVARLVLPSMDARTVAAALERLRADAAAAEGTLVIERAPRAVREAVDPWGPVEPAALDLMRALKAELDPRGVLNPGRFVGGL
jgi:glycolate oxidase FAD binding subunit